MTCLLTDLTEEEVAAIQAEMQSPANVERLHRKFPEANAPCFLLHPRMKEGTPIWRYLWSPVFNTEQYEVRVTEGEKIGPIYNRDPTRGDRARLCQPPAGERPCGVSDADVILRMTDGSLVHKTMDETGATYRRLEDTEEALAKGASVSK